jgi:hypothetical protein
VRLDIPRREPAAVERQDLLVKPFKAPLALSDDPRLEASDAIPRALDLNGPVLGEKRLRC